MCEWPTTKGKPQETGRVAKPGKTKFEKEKKGRGRSRPTTKKGNHNKSPHLVLLSCFLILIYFFPIVFSSLLLPVYIRRKNTPQGENFIPSLVYGNSFYFPTLRRSTCWIWISEDKFSFFSLSFFQYSKTKQNPLQARSIHTFIFDPIFSWTWKFR